MSSQLDHTRKVRPAALRHRTARMSAAGPGQAGQAERNDRLQAEVTQLRRALESRPVIDQALGMVMALGPCGAQAAWEVLVEVSQHTNTKLRAVAAELVAASDGTRMCRESREALAAALRAHRS